ncbi:MAG: NAD-dependent epimerase/dehydratase family protein [Caldilineaceae bacterium]
MDCIAYTPAHTAQDLAVLSATRRVTWSSSPPALSCAGSAPFPRRKWPPVYLTEGYGGGKRRAEEVLLHADAAALGDLRWTVVRPGHIYGPGSQLGCLPLHSRDPRLLASMRTGEPITLVGGGHFLQQPIFVDDLAATILSLAGNVAAHGQILNVAGPDVIESRTYFTEIAAILGVPLDLRSTPVDAYLQAHPESRPLPLPSLLRPEQAGRTGLAYAGHPAGQRAAAAGRPGWTSRRDATSNAAFRCGPGTCSSLRCGRRRHGL